MGYVFGDLKPANMMCVMTDKGKIMDIKLIDLGSVVKVFEKIYITTPTYSAPEYRIYK